LEVQEAVRRSLGGKPMQAFSIDVDDDDEQQALAWAMKESLKSSSRSNRRLKSCKAAVKEKLKRLRQKADDDMDAMALDDTSEEEADDLGDEYDEGRKAATSILETAEQLSAQVLKAMSGWSAQNDKDSSQQGSTPQGIIVDGALSLSSSAAREGRESNTSAVPSQNAQNRWISQAVMRKICPKVKLSDYQLVGVNWLSLLHGMKCSIEGRQDTNVNGILADEMGLGKTVQTITFLAWLKQHHATVDLDSDDESCAPMDVKLPHLIVVPVSVLDNWMREFDTFCPDLKVIKFHGTVKERQELRQTLRPYIPDGVYKGQCIDAIVCPVTYFQKEKSDERSFLMKFKYDYLVCDEAHLLKNAQSSRYKSMNRVKTRHRLLLTGTPVQNSPQELLNMLCFLMPLFSRAKAADSFDEESRDITASEEMLKHFVDQQSEGSGDDAAAYRKLKHLFAPFVLRRKKAEVLAQLIPAKRRVLELVHLDPGARAVYDSMIEAHVKKNGSKVTAAVGEHLFTNLRKAAHHPLMLRTRHTSKQEIDHLVDCFHRFGAFKGDGSTRKRIGEEVSKFSDFEIHLTALELIQENEHRRPELGRYVLDQDALFSSAKCTRLRALLPSLIKDGHRILIFSVWTTCLDLLSCLLESIDVSYMRMDGACPSDTRQDLIDRFNQDESISVFLLSTKACGVGINLTAADTCIMHDLDFNPFNDLQAEDRCHRIGQKKQVTVYKLVTKDTVDEDIYRMQERKSKMNAAIMDSRGAQKERKEMMQSALQHYQTNGKRNHG